MRGIVVAALVATVFAGCGGGSAPRSIAQRAACIASDGYGGLGANASAFDPNNNGSTGRAEPTPGTAWYQIAATTTRGCVAAYTVRDTGTPPLRAHDMLLLISRAYLPRDAQPVVRAPSCAVWKSQMLKRAVGLMYARATGSSQRAGVPGAALIEVTAHSTCQRP
jgi:hypothetical protein